MDIFTACAQLNNGKYQKVWREAWGAAGYLYWRRGFNQFEDRKGNKYSGITDQSGCRIEPTEEDILVEDWIGL